MKTLQTVRSKPNPAGKDRSRWGASEMQLGGEWVDIKNVGLADVALNGIELNHIAYSSDGSKKWEAVIMLSGVLKPGKIVRVHSGKGPVSALLDTDKVGADFHVFSGHDQYVWNNDRGDCAGLWDKSNQAFIDRACYTGKPPEGVILYRFGDEMVPSATASAAARR